MTIMLLEAARIGALLGGLLWLTGVGGSLVALPLLLSIHLPLRDALAVGQPATAFIPAGQDRGLARPMLHSWQTSNWRIPG